MNERIDELLWQAGGYMKLSYPNDTFLDGRYALTQLQLDKFAELIVKECIGIVQPHISRWPEDCELVIKIKEHFGAE